MIPQVLVLDTSQVLSIETMQKCFSFESVLSIRVPSEQEFARGGDLVSQKRRGQSKINQINAGHARSLHDLGLEPHEVRRRQGSTGIDGDIQIAHGIHISGDLGTEKVGKENPLVVLDQRFQRFFRRVIHFEKSIAIFQSHA